MDNSKTLWDGVKNYLGWNKSGAPEIIIDDKGAAMQDPGKIAQAIQMGFRMN